MAFGHIDVPAIVRALTQLAERPDDYADLFLERREETELASHRSPALAVCQDAGLALRLMRDDRCWLASTDHINASAFNEALRRVVRTMPRAPFPHIEMQVETPEPQENLGAMQRFLAEALGQAEARGLPQAELRLRRFVRQVQVITLDRVTGVEQEVFYDVVMRVGRAACGQLLTSLEPPAAEDVVLAAEAAVLGQAALSPPAGHCRCVLDSDAVAVMLHEAVAHALEADLLVKSGRPDAAIGVNIGSPLLHVFDDPSSAPLGVRRQYDDEGSPVIRRYLVRGGLVEQPICDRDWARRSGDFVAGSGRRGDRHEMPGPRSYHLSLTPGVTPLEEMLSVSEGGLYLPRATRGRLDPLSGELLLQFGSGRQIQGGRLGPITGPCSVRARLSDLLGKIIAVGEETRSGGAGWCAKAGVKMPVWATAPALLLDDVEIWP